MLTIATVPKPFKNPHINIIQRNAIQSWLLLEPRPQVILFGNDEGIAEAAKEFGVLHVPEIENEFGIPLLNRVYSLAQKASSGRFVAHINTDIILMSDFMKALGSIKFASFLMTGRRWDINIKEPIQFKETDWEKRFRQRLILEGKLHGLAGVEYFVFPRNLDLNLPPFVAGRPGYDNWLVYKARSSNIPVIDASKVVIAAHQNHDYSHRAGGEKGILKKAEGKRNIKLAGGFAKMLTLRDADWVLTPQGVKKPEFPRRILSELSLFYPWRILLSIKRKIQNII